jgi:cell wall-associated NlpC family hydrolase
VRVQAAKQVYPKRAYSKQTSGVENKQPKNVNEINQVPSGIVADQIIQTGEKYLGTPYRYGTSNGRTFDCSGFIRFIFAQHGITLPSGSYNQAKIGTTVSRSELQKGDLIFFRVGNSSKIGHVAVYAGNNKVLHTYQPGVKYDSLDAPWLKQGYVTAKRVL